MLIAFHHKNPVYSLSILLLSDNIFNKKTLILFGLTHLFKYNISQTYFTSCTKNWYEALHEGIEHINQKEGTKIPSHIFTPTGNITTCMI